MVAVALHYQESGREVGVSATWCEQPSGRFAPLPAAGIVRCPGIEVVVEGAAVFQQGIPVTWREPGPVDRDGWRRPAGRVSGGSSR